MVGEVINVRDNIKVPCKEIVEIKDKEETREKKTQNQDKHSDA
jgi:hypothetical protein